MVLLSIVFTILTKGNLVLAQFHTHTLYVISFILSYSGGMVAICLIAGLIRERMSKKQPAPQILSTAWIVWLILIIVLTAGQLSKM